MNIDTTTSDSSGELLDGALSLLKTIGHYHGVDPVVRQHIEYAAAHLRQAWIANDGQHAQTPAATYQAVAGFYRLQASILSKASRPVTKKQTAEDPGNACLIAAAAELLAATRGAYAELKQWHQTYHADCSAGCPCLAAMDACRVAIDKTHP